MSSLLASQGPSRTKDAIFPPTSFHQSVNDVAPVQSPNSVALDSTITSALTHWNPPEDARYSSELDSGSDSISNNEPTESSLDRLSTPATPPKDSESGHAEREGSVFPPLPSSAHLLARNQTSQYELAFNGCNDNFGAKGEFPLSTLIYASWALVAARMSSEDTTAFAIFDKEVDSPSALPIRVECSPNQTIFEYVRAVDVYTTSQKAFQSFPKGKRSGAELRTLLVVQNGTDFEDHGCNHSSDETNTTSLDNLPGFNGYALILKLFFQESSLRAEVSFDGGVLDVWLIPKLIKRLEMCIQQLCSADPGKLLMDVDMMSPDDLAQIWEWNDPLPAAVERCMHDVFQDQTVAQPNATAIDAWDGQLTYAELNQLSERLASHLVGLGVKPEVIVPLCFEKSMWMPVAMMGVLKAGGAFSLLEPSFPENRLQTIVNELGANIVLSSPSNMSICSRLAENILQIDSNSLNSFSADFHRRKTPQSSSTAMFAVFTSGSTGKPKGAILTHTNYASALHHQLQRLGFSKESRVFDFASYAFDVSVHNVFATLTSGACLCIPSDHDRRNRISEVMAKMNVTIAHLTPSVTRLIDPAAVPSLKTIIFTGEPLPVDEAMRWWGRANIVNEYGPAECTINTVNNNPLDPKAATKIGPTVGVAGWVVDPENQDHLVPIGSVGELLIEGALVGRGYINDAAKTAAAFIENPKWLLRGAPGHRGRTGRLYKTGDLVRYGEGGSLSFLGRKDAQVKIHGQRVDLREVEQWVQACMPQAEQVVAEVIVPQAIKLSPILAAFIQSREMRKGAALNDDAVEISSVPTEAQAKLAQHLPSYVVPTVFFWMNRLPMTPTGKMNRRGLRDIGSSYSVEQLAKARADEKCGLKKQPSSEMEQRLRAVWAWVLGMDPVTVGLDDNFFHLGGDSIASMKVVAEARKLDIQVAVADIFRHPSLGDLARYCHQLLDSSLEKISPFHLLGDDLDRTTFLREISVRYAWEPAKVEDAYPCTRLQEGLMFLTSKRPGDYIEQSVLRLTPNISLEGLHKAWEQVYLAKPILRTRLVHHKHFGILQLVLNDKPHWTETTGLERHLLADRNRSMNLGDPLSRLALVSDESGVPRWLVWTIHHAIYDGWSIRLVTDALSQAYAGHHIEQGPQFQTFVKYIQDQDNERATEYWRNALSGFNTTPFPPPMHSINQPVADSVVKHSLSKPNATTGYITTSLLIRAAWGLVVGRMANTSDVVFGSTLYGRNAAVAGLDEMVAPTIATVPVRVRFARSQKVTDYLQAIQQEAAEMIPYEQLGLQKIASICLESRKACQFQTHVVIQPDDDFQSNNPLGEWSSGSQEEWFSTYALTVELWIRQDSIAASAMFDSRLIEAWVVKKMLRRLEHVMEQLVQASPMQMLSEIETMSEDDREQIWRWNEKVPEQINRCVQDLLADQVAARPEAPVVCAWDGELTYSKLDVLSTKFSMILRELGYGSGTDLIPLCFEKSMWTVVATMGVLKANCGFILLDPKLPEQRLQNIVHQAKSSLIVTCPSKKDLCLRLAENVAVLDHDLLTAQTIKEDALMSPASPLSVAYAIFTSGSTGVPKGVLISHQNAVSAQYHQCTIMGYSTETRLFDFASYSFDVSISNIFSVIACGGCLCIPSEDGRKNQLEESILSLSANALDLTPSILQLLSPKRLPKLRLLTLGGEPLHATDVQEWCGKVRICNAYGPSECTATSTINCNPVDPLTATSIGKGAGVVTWVVDAHEHDELLPLGCTGELLVEGPLVGLGYLNDPTKTSAAFIEDPKWLLRGSASRTGRSGRLYKTGDLVRYNEDGSLTFIGRKDTQIKVRGQRIESDEIEAVLRSHESVKDAVVVLQGQNGGEPRLAGFVTIHKGKEADLQDQEHHDTREISQQKAEKVRSWETQFDAETYVSIDQIQPEAIGKDFTGWSSMYNGAEIDKAEMHEWLDDTISTILNGGPAGHVLEIGTGSGMMLFNLASRGLETYIGIEPSARAVDYTTRVAKSIPALTDKVRVFKGTAEDVFRLDQPISPNLVIINSVVQYFPSQDYLLHIIQQAINIDEVETIFLGDVRSYALHREFLAQRTLHIAKHDASLEEFSHILGNLEKVESELLLDPGFFTALPGRFSRIRHVEILPKKMMATNELSSYRYAAILHISPRNEQAIIPEIQDINQNSWIDYISARLTRQLMLELLVNSSARAPIAVCNIPYSKTIYEREIVSAVEASNGESSGCSDWLSVMRQSSQQVSALCALDLVDLAKETGYKVEISWARQCSQCGGLDAIFHRSTTNLHNDDRRSLFKFPTDHQGRANHLLSSTPLRQQIEATTIEKLDKLLKSLLPSYMVPQTITILDKMPVNHNDKIDRHQLSHDYESDATPVGEKRMPTTDAQKVLQSIWSDVLSIECRAIGLDDGFIQLGGNSLAAMKVVSLAREAGFKLEVADMFRHSITSIQRLLDAVSSVEGEKDDAASRKAIVNRIMSNIDRHDCAIAAVQCESSSCITEHLAQSDNDQLLTVLLTGANGFIGTQILRQLLEHGRVRRVIAIARGTSASAARQRVVDAAERAQWWTEFHSSMLEVWPGDLGLPKLGLEEAAWQEITDGAVDILVHNGASVHFMKSYMALESTNVGSTVQLLRAAARSPEMKLVYVSSARCSDPQDESEESVAEELAANPNGYNETKFVAEALVRRAAARSCARKDQFVVVSPGLVVGTPTEGVPNADDWLWRMAAACLRVGIFNGEESDNWVPIADAAATAATVLDAAINQPPAVVTQVKGGLTMGELWATLSTAGYVLRSEPAIRCMAAIRKDVEENKETHPLGALSGMLESLGDTAKAQWAPSWYNGGFSSPTRLRVALVKSAEFLSKVGTLPPPGLVDGARMREAQMAAFSRSAG